MRFELSSSECELLLAFEKAPSLSELAETLGRDISVVSRNLKSIAEKSDVLEKHKGRWVLTEKGLALNRWSEEAIQAQRLILLKQKIIKIAAPREFSSRILLPKARDLFGEVDINITIISSDEGIEKLLLNGDADFGFDCGRPFDPLIAFKHVADESFVAVATPKFLKKRKIKNYDDLTENDCLSFTRSSNIKIDIDIKSSNYFGRFSDVSIMREACLLSYGWCVLPYYAVRDEIDKKKLQAVNGFQCKNARYGVWWTRERKSAKPWVEKAILWLADQEKNLTLS